MSWKPGLAFFFSRSQWLFFGDDFSRCETDTDFCFYVHLAVTARESTQMGGGTFHRGHSRTRSNLVMYSFVDLFRELHWGPTVHQALRHTHSVYCGCCHKEQTNGNPYLAWVACVLVPSYLFRRPKTENHRSPGLVSEALSLYVALSLLRHDFIDLFFFLFYPQEYFVCKYVRAPCEGCTPRGRSLDLHMKENTWCLSFWAWVTALSVIFSRAKKAAVATK